MRHRIRASASHVPTYPADEAASMAKAACKSATPERGADRTHSCNVEPPCAASSKAMARPSCTDLHIASNPRALIATRSACLSDRHARNLRQQGKHIGFVVDSGCTYHIHPHVDDLINLRPCTETVSGVDGKPRPCVAVGDLPLSVRDSHNRIVDFTLSDVRCVPSMRDSL
eukprot:1309822-Pleurochrysis_carterae.AAC.1